MSAQYCSSWWDCFVGCIMDIEAQPRDQVTQMWNAQIPSIAPEGRPSALKKERARARQTKEQCSAVKPERRSSTPGTHSCPPLPTPRGRSSRSDPGAGLRAFLEPRTREHHDENDEGHRRVARTGRCLFESAEELFHRATKLKHAKPEDDLIKTLIQYQYVVMDEQQSLHFTYFQWNPTRQTLEINPDKTSLSVQHVMTQLTGMLALLQQHSLIIRFGALRPNAQIQQTLNKDHGSNPPEIPWRRALAKLHQHSPEMRSLWQELSHSGVWQLILGRMRQANLQRTLLANHLGKWLEAM